MSQARAIDHIGLVARDLREPAATLTALGFHLTPLARHAGGRTGNRCAMLNGSYLELMSTVDGGESATLDRFLARHTGAHILSLRIDDEQAAAERLAAAGLGTIAPSLTDRAVDDADPDGPRARFVLVTPPDIPEGRVHLIRHLTPEAVWQPGFLDHPNRVTALAAVVIASDRPADSAYRLSLRAGRPVRPDPRGGYVLELPSGSIRILPPDAAQALLPGVVLPGLPAIVGLMLTTDDGNAALSALWRGPARRQGDALLIDAAGVTLCFGGG